MTTTPTIWRSSSTAYADISGLQGTPHIIGLTNGDYLVVWSDDTKGTGAGTNVSAQRFTAEGIRIGGPIQLNTVSTGDNEVPTSVIALPDGGFVVAYRDDEGAGADVLRIERYDSAGAQTFSTSITNFGFAGSVPGSHAGLGFLAVNAAGDYVITYHWNGKYNDIGLISWIFDGLTNAVKSKQEVGDHSRHDNIFEGTISLSDGDFVSLFTASGTPSSLKFKIFDSLGVQQAAPVTVFQGSFGDTGIAPLAGGGFVVAWEGVGSNISFRIADNAGVLGDTFTESSGTHDLLFPELIGLRDGGFFLVWFDNETLRLVGQRYDAAGDRIGSRLLVASNATGITDTELALTSDGRILVTYMSQSGEVKHVILDPRDNIITGTDASETITTQIGSTALFGKGGDDLLLGQGGDDTVHGDSGNDSVRGGLGNDALFGDADADRLEGGLGADSLDGGEGSDTAVYINATSGVTINLTTGLGALNQAEGDSFVGIENVEGSDFGDTLIGNGEVNELYGRGGADTLHGGPGGDLVDGGNGNDLIVIGDSDFGDQIRGRRGTDTLDLHTMEVQYVTVNLREGWLAFHGGQNTPATLSSIEIVIATDGDDTLEGSDAPEALFGGLGNDEFIGFGGADKFVGGPGLDSVDYVEATAGVEIDLAAGLGRNDEAEGDTFTGIETVIGSEHDDILAGNEVRNIIFGRSGDDKAIGAGV
jgi:Ca2+-binding RTX toxin-like protein